MSTERRKPPEGGSPIIDADQSAPIEANCTPGVSHPGCRQCELEAASDVALATGDAVTLSHLGLIVVPDTLIVEGAANGHDSPDTWRLRRADGRTTWLYALPAGAA